MHYAILAYDYPDSAARRAQVRETHLARAQALQARGLLTLAGPLRDGDGTVVGSLLILSAESLAEATRWAQADVYVEAKVWQRVEVFAFQRVLP